ncbi:MAG: succinylglutamate desuccinylase/aspartoacylase family protein, partial [Gammaproteobacteria bacterium]|nr:succinylglutamate desuccinylase/aspartoacylase family protein [Gammaproteobacteria bacterium]NNJ84415.1 succinylglutamate desuccinylase [Gammaproteobacteria bacterium]
MPANMPVRIIHGRKFGPVLFVSAAVHGDEIIGVEIIRRLLRASAIRRLKGTLLCVPVVNTLGFVNHQRYLPDRRDLNRNFPGRPEGSLAGQLAHLFIQEIVMRSDFGIDLHSAAIHRVNLPQIRFFASRPETKEMAMAFGA